MRISTHRIQQRRIKHRLCPPRVPTRDPNGDTRGRNLTNTKLIFRRSVTSTRRTSRSFFGSIILTRSSPNAINSSLIPVNNGDYSFRGSAPLCFSRANLLCRVLRRENDSLGGEEQDLPRKGLHLLQYVGQVTHRTT